MLKKTKIEIVKGQSDIDMKNNQSHLVFLRTGKVYAIDLMRVKRVINNDNVLNIPNMPDFIYGCVNVGGLLVPIIDLSIRLEDKMTRESSRQVCIVIVEMIVAGYAMEIGLVVDALHEVIDLHLPKKDTAPLINEFFRAECCKSESGSVIVLDIDNLLSIYDLNNMLLALGELKKYLASCVLKKTIISENITGNIH